MNIFWLILLLEIYLITDGTHIRASEEEQNAEIYLKEISQKLVEMCHKNMEAQVTYASNTKDTNASLAKEMAVREHSEYEATAKLELNKRFPNWRTFSNEITRKQLWFLLNDGVKLASREIMDKYIATQLALTQKQAAVKICDFKNKTNCDLRLVPDLAIRFRGNPSIEETEYYISEWYNAAGSAITSELYSEYVKASNDLAQVQGLSTYCEFWYTHYNDMTGNWTSEKFLEELDTLADQFAPYYNKLHAYVRMLIRQRDPKRAALITEEGYMPIHMLNSFWGHDWTLIGDLTRPFPNAVVNKDQDITIELENAGFTPIRIVQEAVRFFTSLDPEWTMPQSFWEKSLFERPKDREPHCHPTAYDGCINEDFRLHICLKISEGDLRTAYHEVGHVVYFKSYKHLPFLLRTGANPGFHEAVGDTISLSVTPKHFKCFLNLTNLKNSEDIHCGKTKLDKKYEITEKDINILYRKALSKIPRIPFDISLSRWRRKIFQGKFSANEYNTEWWNIRKELAGVVPPSPRDPKLLDMGALYHITMNMAYVHYFVSEILQFQFYETLCIAAGEYNPNDEKTRPLHQCDFSNSLEAGKKLRDMMSKGSSQSWKQTLKEFTGTENLSIDSLVRYFQPLFDFIDKELKKNNEVPCFGKNCSKT